MCGIIGYVGYRQATPVLLQGLERLEYRGYDSMGVAVLEGGQMQVVKAVGRLQGLREKIATQGEVCGSLGIGHTRWATHGQPSEKNSHPHIGQHGKIAIVHNGIIENFLELKAELEAEGVQFATETDSEVVAQLIEAMYDGDLFKAVVGAVRRFRGAYSLGIVCKDEPGKLLAVRKESPLVIGLSEGENFLASDAVAIPSTGNMIRLREGEVAVMTPSSVEVFDENHRPVESERFVVDWNREATGKAEFEHFMMKEIMEQPRVLRDTILPRICGGDVHLQELERLEFNKINKISIVACGSAYHAGFVGKYLLEKLLRLPVEIDVASEFRYKEPVIDEKTLVLAISQSGETADTLAAVREAKKLGAPVLSIVNVVGSPIANESDSVLYTQAGAEIAVATTKAYSAQLAVIYLLAVAMGEKLGKISLNEKAEMLKSLTVLPEKVEEILSQTAQLKRLATQFSGKSDMFFIGRNLDYAVAMEGSLKLKEISYIHSEAYAAGELKHGTISLIEVGTPVVVVATQSALCEKIASNVVQLKARGAWVLGVCTEGMTAVKEACDEVVTLPEIDDIFMPSLAVVPLQLLSYFVALEKGCDIDKPRNLAKSVTVE